MEAWEHPSEPLQPMYRVSDKDREQETDDVLRLQQILQEKGPTEAPVPRPRRQVRQFSAPTTIRDVQTDDPYFYLDKRIADWLDPTCYFQEVNNRFVPLLNLPTARIFTYEQLQSLIVQCGLFHIDNEVYYEDRAIAMNCSFCHYDSVEASQVAARARTSGVAETTFDEEDILPFVEDELRVRFYVKVYGEDQHEIRPAELEQPVPSLACSLHFFIYTTCF